MTALGITLKATREALGLSIDEFAARVGVPSIYVRRIESGRQAVSPIMRNHLSRVVASSIAP